MDIQVLEEKRADLQRQFDELARRKKEAEELAAGCGRDMVALQGGHKVLTELIGLQSIKEPSVAVKDEGKPKKEK